MLAELEVETGGEAQFAERRVGLSRRAAAEVARVDPATGLFASVLLYCAFTCQLVRVQGLYMLFLELAQTVDVQLLFCLFCLEGVIE